MVDGKKHLLLVEDEKILALSEAKKLNGRGYEVTILHSGEEAVEFIQKAPRKTPDLVLMDIDLGDGMDGTEAAEEILGIRFLPIVFLTSHSEEEIVEKVRKITRYGYVIKNSGDFVLFSSIEMAFQLYEAHAQVMRDQKKYMTIFNNVNDAVYLHKVTPEGSSGGFLEVNDVACSQLGYSREEFLSMSPSDIDTPKNAELEIKRLSTITNEGTIRFDTDHVTKEGEEIPVEVNSQLFYLKGERVILSVARDMRERKEKEERLRFLSMVMDQIQDRITVTDLEGNITYINEAEAKMFGVPKEKLLGKNISSYGDDSSRGGTQEEILKEAKENGRWRGEVVNYTPSGEERVLDARVQVIRDEKGKEIALCGISTDITERKELENNLRVREENLDVTLNSIGDGVIVADTTGRVTRLNPKAEELTGWSQAAAEGKFLDEVFNIINAKTREPAFQPFQRVISTGEVVGLANHTVLIARDGTERQIADSAAPIRSKDRSLIGVVLVFRDVTLEYRLQEELRESKTRLETAQRVASLGSWEFDFSTGLVKASKEAHRIYGIPQGELTIQKAQSVVLAEYRPRMDEALKDLIEKKLPYDIEFMIRREDDGRIVHIHSVAEYDPEHNRVLGTIQDITKRKEAEQRLREDEAEISELLKEKELLLQEVHHRIKNNMNTIAGLLSLRANSVNEEDTANILEEMRNRVYSMQLIYERLYRTDDYLTINVEEYVQDLLADLTDSYLGENGKKYIAIESTIEDVPIDSKKIFPLGIIINELVTNALRHAFDDGETGKISVILDKEDDGGILLTVKDSGRGLPDGFCLDKSGGFGFSLVEMLVKQLKGKMSHGPGPGDRGTIFTISFPL